MTPHRESPSRRVNPSGKVVWVARYTNREGKRVLTKPRATYALKGPCRKPREDGECCAQHRIDVAYRRDELGPARTGTVVEFARQWLRDSDRSERTNHTNAHRLEVVLGPFTEEQVAREKAGKYRSKKKREGVLIGGIPLGEWRLDELRPRHGKELLSILLVDQGRSPTGAKNILLTLSAMFNEAIRDELALVNPWAIRVKATDPRAKKKARAPRLLTWDDMHRLASAAGEHEPMIRVAADCGLRLGELLGLAVQDVKLGRCDEPGCAVTVRHLHVRRTAHRGVVSLGTKRERMRDRLEGGRIVPLHPETAALLLALPTRIAPREGDPVPMFFDPRGRTWREDTFRQEVWNPARRASGVEASPHDFRHSWVSNLRATGVDPADLALMAGHSVEVATAVYTHALERSYETVLDRVGVA